MLDIPETKVDNDLENTVVSEINNNIENKDNPAKEFLDKSDERAERRGRFQRMIDDFQETINRIKKN